MSDTEGDIETTQPGNGILMRERGKKEAYLWAGADGTVDVRRFR